MRIRAVFFDMGGTIETFGATPELRLKAVPGLRACLEQAGIDIPLDDQGLLDIVSSGLDRYKRWSIESLQELPPAIVWQKYVFDGLAVDSGLLESVAEDLAYYVETRFYERRMRPEMPQVLEALVRMGLRLGVISNVNSRGQVPGNLAEYGIRHFFDPIILSSEYGRRKPDPAIFHYAARLVNVPASECAYVGDRIVRDIDGARRAGFGLAIQIRHDFAHGENDEGATPDAVIADMTKLVEILRSHLDTTGALPQAEGVRAILFDAGDILYHRPHRGRNFKTFLQGLGREVSEIPAGERERLSRLAYRGKIDQEQYQEAILRLYGLTEPSLITRGKQALSDDENNVEFFEGVCETLIALKQAGFFLGIVTDTANPIHAKLRWFERGGFGHVWDSIISSKEVGTRKPDPRIYAAALRQLGVNADQAVFVGHRIEELDGAHKAGIKTIAFNYDAGASADYFIEKFADLLSVPVIARTEKPAPVDA
ncbi:MAG: HAD family hydrolase [Anaerolineae bacterium]